MYLTQLSKLKKFAIFGIALCICAVGGAVYRHAHQTHTAVISLTYQNASSGLNPDGTRLDPYLATSDEVLENAEQTLDHSIDRASIWVRPSYAGNGATYATKYTITYQGADGDNVLHAVVSAWEAAFAKHDGTNRSVEECEKAPDDLDYLEIAEWLNKEAEQIRCVANQRLKEDKVWTPESGMSYADIVSAAENIKSVDIANLRTYIVQNGLSKDPDALTATIEYRNRELQKRKDETDAQYKNRTAAIALYDSTLFPTISVPSISNGVYYATTTQTGLDYIYQDAQWFLNSSLAIQKTITDNKALLANSAQTPSTDTLNDLNARISAIEQRIQGLADSCAATDEEYVQSELQPWYTITYAQ